MQVFPDFTDLPEPSDEDQASQRRQELLMRYVREVEPQIMEEFADRAPTEVVDAMRQTIANMLGTLPHQFFKVTVSTVGENLAQLMYSFLMTGYMFRNAQYRLELQDTVHALPSGQNGARQTAGAWDGGARAGQAPTACDQSEDGVAEGRTDDHVKVGRDAPLDEGVTASMMLDGRDGYAPGVQTNKVEGQVLRWHEERGVEALPATEYIQLLEAEIRDLRRSLDEDLRRGQNSNAVLDYLKTMEPRNLEELSSRAGEDVVAAMNAFVERLMGTDDPLELRSMENDSTVVELAQLLYWLLIVGYSLRAIEVRLDMASSLGVAGRSLQLPSPGVSLDDN